VNFHKTCLRVKTAKAVDCDKDELKIDAPALLPHCIASG